MEGIMAYGKGTINKVILIGRLGVDPELRYTPAGAAVASFSLATNMVWKDQEGKQQEKTEWHRIIAWRKLGEFCGEWLKKGSQIYVEGRIQTRSWDDKDGIKRYMTEIIADTIQLLGSRREDQSTEKFEPPAQEEAPEGDAGAPPEDDLPF